MQNFTKQLQMEPDRDEERQKRWELIEQQAKLNTHVGNFNG
jgi:hypothetical protein